MKRQSIVKSVVLATMTVVSGLAWGYGIVKEADYWSDDGIYYRLAWDSESTYMDQAILMAATHSVSDLEISTITYTPEGETRPRTFPVIQINGAAFAGGLANGSMTFPNVKDVKSDTFAACEGLTAITLGTVTCIGDRAFDGCTSLSTITLGGTTAPTVGSDAFRNVPATMVHVHCTSTGFPAQDETWNGLRIAYIEGRIEKYYGVTVNGLDVGFVQGDDWVFMKGVLSLNGKGPYVLSGSNTKGEVRVVQCESAKVTLKNLVLTTASALHAPFEVGSEQNMSVDLAVASQIYLEGDNCLTNANGSASTVARQAALAVHRGSHLTINATHADATLTVKGATYGAGIGGGRYCSTGVITIAGGIIDATGGEKAAGIGGGYYEGTAGEVPGTIIIEGGRVTARGDAGAPGIGAGYDLDKGVGYTVQIKAGTVTAVGGADAGYDIFAGKIRTADAPVVITGGSVNATVYKPRNAEDKTLWRVTVPVEHDGSLYFYGVPDDYGKGDIFAVDGKASLWLPNGDYTVRDYTDGRNLWARVADADVVAVPIDWDLGEGVHGSWEDGVVAITGAGTVMDFADESEIPWKALPVTGLTIVETVTPGKNLVAGLADTVTVNGATLALMRQLVGGDAIIGGLTPAGATAIAVKDGKVKLTVQVETTTDLGEEAEWQPATVADGELTAEGDGVILTLPAAAEKGYYILKTK